MIRLCLWTIAAGIILFALTASLFARPTFIYFTLFTILFLAISVTQVSFLLMGIRRWRKKTKSWFFPATVCALTISLALYLGVPVGRYLSDHKFKKDSDKYVKVIEQFRNGELICVTHCNGEVKVIKTDNLPPNIRQVYGTHCDTGGVLVLFSEKTNVPMLHEGYLFKD